MIYVEDIAFRYETDSIIRDITADFSDERLTGIIGPNGVGKSTLLKCMVRLLKPCQGAIYLDDRDLFAIRARELAKLQAYVPQNSSLIFQMPVKEYVTLGRRPYVEWSLKKEDMEIVDEMMDYLSIQSMADKYMNEISGGEKQKVMLARALVQQPDVLMLDEPTSALDIRHQLEVMELLRKISKEKKCAVIIVMHDLMLVARYCDKVILMKDGEIYASGTPLDTITEENVRQVYGIHTRIIYGGDGMIIVPLKGIG